MKDIFFFSVGFFRQVFPCENFPPRNQSAGYFSFWNHPYQPPSKVKWSFPDIKVKAHRSHEVHWAGTWPSFCSFCEMKQLRIETFRFEEENGYQYKIWLTFFRVFSKNRHPGKLHSTFDSPEKHCHLYWRKLSSLPIANDKTSNTC